MTSARFPLIDVEISVAGGPWRLIWNKAEVFDELRRRYGDEKVTQAIQVLESRNAATLGIALLRPARVRIFRRA